MTSKERVLRNYTFQPVDRFTIDFCAESKVYARMREHYGVSADLAPPASWSAPRKSCSKSRAAIRPEIEKEPLAWST